MKYRSLKGYKYQLAESCTINLPGDALAGEMANNDYVMLINNHLLINEGYAWDGPSGPAVDTKNFMRGSLVHDALYQLIREGLLPKSSREAADRALVGLCRADGMGRFRSWYIYHAVRMFAGGATKPRKRVFDEIIEV